MSPGFPKRVVAGLSAVVAALALGSWPAFAGAASPERPLGRGHIWLKVDRADFDSDVNEEWGVDSETYFGVEGCWHTEGRFYLGIELGAIDVGSAADSEGHLLQDVSFFNGEFNTKVLFPFKHGLSVGVGAGLAGVWVDGEEVDEFGPSDLADISFGFQGFVELNWRVRHLVTGLEVKYQWAEDFVAVDYSNLRLGARVGVVF